jgi:hypothetical protein
MFGRLVTLSLLGLLSLALESQEIANRTSARRVQDQIQHSRRTSAETSGCRRCASTSQKQTGTNRTLMGH